MKKKLRKAEYIHIKFFNFNKKIKQMSQINKINKKIKQMSQINEI